jgi:UDP-glucose 4-epimerase
MKEQNVIGTMQLLAACQQAPSLRHLVVKSSTAFYGATNRDPAMFTEDMGPKRQARAGYAKDVAEVESYVRGFSRRRPDVTVTMLRAANVIGPLVNSPIVSYFRLPVIPTVLGFDARLQFLHEHDLLGAIQHATLSGVHGTFNVAGDGLIMLSQAIRRIGRPSLKLPTFAVASFGSAIRQVRLADFSPEQVQFLTYGRGVDTTRMRTVLGLPPALHDARGLRRLRHRSSLPDCCPPSGSRPPRRRSPVRSARRAVRPGTRPRSEATVPDADIIPLGDPDRRSAPGSARPWLRQCQAVVVLTRPCRQRHLRAGPKQRNAPPRQPQRESPRESEPAAQTTSETPAGTATEPPSAEPSPVVAARH